MKRIDIRWPISLDGTSHEVRLVRVGGFFTDSLQVMVDGAEAADLPAGGFTAPTGAHRFAVGDHEVEVRWIWSTLSGDPKVLLLLDPATKAVLASTGDPAAVSRLAEHVPEGRARWLLIQGGCGCATVVLLLVLLLVGALLWGRLSGSNDMSLEVPLLHEPRFERVRMDSDESCSTLFDYCIRVTCTVANRGNAVGTRTVHLWVDQGGPELAHVSSLTLRPGEERTIAHDFTEASLDTEWRYGCSIDRGVTGR